MNQTFEMPKLQILPVEALWRHEWHDQQRAKPLIEKLRASGVLRNPPVVTPFEDGSGRYMVLDGANRTTAFEQMGLPHCICQVVKADNPSLDLRTWNHVLWNWEPEAFLDALRGMEEMTLRDIDPNIKRPQNQWPVKTLVWVQTPDEKAYIARSEPGDLVSRANKLSEIAGTYKAHAELDRTTAQQVGELDGVYEKLCAVVVYPPFTVREVLELCGEGVLLPPGVTRFTISPRALRVNYSLEALGADKELNEKNVELERWVNEHMARRGVRFYAEATVLYDE